MISSSLLSKIGMDVYSVSLRMIWDAVGTLRAPKVKGSPFFWAARRPDLLWKEVSDYRCRREWEAGSALRGMQHF